MSPEQRTANDLARWLDAQTSMADYLEDVMRLSRASSQRPGWSFPSLWLPSIAWPSPRLRMVALVALVAAAALGAALVAGALLSDRPGPRSNGIIAYAAWLDPQSPTHDVFLVGPGEEPVRRVGRHADGLIRNCPAFSPDGRWLAFGERELAGTDTASPTWLVVVDPADLSQRLRVSLGEQFADPCPAWSTDATNLQVVVRNAYGPGADGCCEEAAELWSVPLDGGAITTAPAAPFDEVSPSVLYDDSGVVRVGSLGVSVHLNDGSVRRIATTDRASDLREEFSWAVASPVGPYIAMGGGLVRWYGSTGESIGGFVRIVDLDGRVLLAYDRPAGHGGGSWSSTGRLAWPSQPGVVVFDPTTGAGPTLGPWTIDGRTVLPASGVTWSPDGERLLFAAVAEEAENAFGHALVSVRVESEPDPIRHTPWTPWLELARVSMSWQGLPR
jgi:hypothetical protein